VHLGMKDSALRVVVKGEIEKEGGRFPQKLVMSGRIDLLKELGGRGEQQRPLEVWSGIVVCEECFAGRGHSTGGDPPPQKGKRSGCLGGGAYRFMQKDSHYTEQERERGKKASRSMHPPGRGPLVRQAKPSHILHSYSKP